MFKCKPLEWRKEVKLTFYIPHKPNMQKGSQGSFNILRL